MKTIYKYPLTPVDGWADTKMPQRSNVVHVGADPQGIPCVWAIVDTELPLETRRFATLGTGHPMDWLERTGFYIGTINHGPFMWHVFEQIKSV